MALSHGHIILYREAGNGDVLGSLWVSETQKSARKLFRRSLELMVLKDHELGRNPTFPPYAFHQWPFHTGISFCIGKRAMAMF